MPRVALLLNTLGRTEMTIKVLSTVLDNCGHEDVQLYVNDQGTHDRGLFKFLAERSETRLVVIQRENIGVAGGINCMMKILEVVDGLPSYYCVLDNDILLPDGWLRRLVMCAVSVPNSGVSGIHCVEQSGKLSGSSGYEFMKLDSNCLSSRQAVFGTKFFPLHVRERLGYFQDRYSKYGLEDGDFSYRSQRAGFVNYYIAGLKSEHIGTPYGKDDSGTYRAEKDAELKRAGGKEGVFMPQYAQSLFVTPSVRSTAVAVRQRHELLNPLVF